MIKNVVSVNATLGGLKTIETIRFHRFLNEPVSIIHTVYQIVFPRLSEENVQANLWCVQAEVERLSCLTF